MEEFSKEAWIIMYTYDTTEDWIGCFPDYLYQWFICDNVKSTHPKIFDSKNEAEIYAKDNALIKPRIIQVAGKYALDKFENENKAIEWVEQHLPFAIKRTKKSKTTFVNPFTSTNAFKIVAECVGKALFNSN